MRLFVATYAALTLLACHGGNPPETSSASSGTPTVDATGPGTKESSGGSADSSSATTGGTAETAPTTTPTTTPTATPAADSARCGDKTCAAGESCISYFGIAGPRGPEFHECGIKCRRGERNDGCPSGKKCIQIADGPGDVCR